MGKCTTCAHSEWCKAGVLALCGDVECEKLHLDDATEPTMGSMVPHETVRELAVMGRAWLANMPKTILAKFSREVASTGVNVCLRERKPLDLCSLFDTILSHIQFLPVATLSPNLRKCLCLFVKWIYASAAAHKSLF